MGITGSNGKTTTTALIEHILRGSGCAHDSGGQHWNAADFAASIKRSENTVTVVELSSFQLELIDTFRPNIGLFLNLTPDHLDRHHTLKAYGDAKARIFENQTADDSAILNADDAATAAYAPRSRSCIGSAASSASHRERICAAKRSYCGSTAKITSFCVAAKFLWRVLTISRMCWLHVVGTKLAGATVPAIAAGSSKFRWSRAPA